jgi:hypothetical protein
MGDPHSDHKLCDGAGLNVDPAVDDHEEIHYASLENRLMTSFFS